MNRSPTGVAPDDVDSRTTWLDGIAVRSLLAILFLSGAAALIFEISWARQIGLLIGNTSHSAAVVLTAYFTGMAIGYLLAARITRWMRPLIAYAAMECLVASWALFLPQLLSMALSSGIAAYLQPHALGAQITLRWLFCFLLLLPATAALGATIPLIADWLLVANRRGAEQLTAAYAVNTAGAFLGIVLATAWLLGNAGVTRSSTIAACLSVFCGAAAGSLDLVMRMASPKVQPLTNPTPLPNAMNQWLGPSLIPVAISGFGVLALEVLYARLFSLVFHNSSYTFGTILAAVILAIALAPFLLRRLLVRCDVQSMLIWVSAAGCFAIIWSAHLFVALTRLEYFRWGDSFAAYLAGTFAVIAAIIAPPMLLSGMIIPLAWRLEADRGRLSSAIIGRTLFINQPLVGAGSRVTHKGLDLARRRRQADQIDRESSDQRSSVGHGRRRQSLFFEPVQDEMIYWIDGPLGLVHTRQRNGLQRLQGPPVAAGAFLAAGLRRRHSGKEYGKASAGNESPIVRRLWFLHDSDSKDVVGGVTEPANPAPAQKIKRHSGNSISRRT